MPLTQLILNPFQPFNRGVDIDLQQPGYQFEQISKRLGLYSHCMVAIGIAALRQVDG